MTNICSAGPRYRQTTFGIVYPPLVCICQCTCQLTGAGTSPSSPKLSGTFNLFTLTGWHFQVYSALTRNDRVVNFVCLECYRTFNHIFGRCRFFHHIGQLRGFMDDIQSIKKASFNTQNERIDMISTIGPGTSKSNVVPSLSTADHIDSHALHCTHLRV